MTQNSVVRLESIEIRDFKNVRFGRINFRNMRKTYDASVLGLYGQNGSGKTALIEALYLLKCLLTQRPIPQEFVNLIYVGSECAALKYEFSVVDIDSEETYSAMYECRLRKSEEEVAQSAGYIDAEDKQYKVAITDEVLSYAYVGNKKRVKFGTVVDTRTESDEVFVPKTKYHMLVGKNKATKTALLVAKKLALETSRSFVFSKALGREIKKNSAEPYHLHLFARMALYGFKELFVIPKDVEGLIAFDALPLNFKFEMDTKISAGSVAIQMGGPSPIPTEVLEVVKNVFEKVNIVLTQLVPGLTIGLRDLGTELADSGIVMSRVQLTSRREGREIPMMYESDGIKKIVSVLHLLIVMYNQASVTVAIDELDSGVFEYLLGELLHIISEQGKGQLIFTSHNLRPLETLDRGFIAFTTTNADNRYIRLSNVKANHNLRDFYYRDIILGEQNEPVYEPTNNYEIAFAFREAGELSGV